MQIAFLLVVAATGAFAAVLRDRAVLSTDYALKEEGPVPSSWKRIADADPGHIINLNIGLKQSNFAELERHLYEVSDPDHARYGSHLSATEVDELVKPHDETTKLVHEWLDKHRIDIDQMSYSTASDWINIRIPVSQVETLLDTRYSVFRHEDGTHLVRTTGWSLPRHLHDHIDTIAPTNSFARFAPQVKYSKRSVDSVPQMTDSNEIVRLAPQDIPSMGDVSDSGRSIQKACNFSAVTPTCLRTLYGTIDYKPQSAGKNKIGIANYLMQTQNRSDLALFLKKYRPEAVGMAKTFPFRIIRNGQNKQTQLTAAEIAASLDVEGNLDGETILAGSYPTPLTAFNTGGMPPYQPDLVTPTDTNEPYLPWVNYVLGLDDAAIPQVISTSYGDDEQTVPPSYRNRVCQQYARLGARGVTLLFSSGDSGVGANDKCFSNNAADGRKNEFLPAFSASCPYVTAVGGTKDYPEVVAFDPKNGYSPGGGFSNYFARPAYQNKVVSSYIKSLNGRFDGLYNKTGRAYPDIVAQSQSFVIAYNGSFVLVDGTSAASPTAASVLTLVNDALIAAGKPVLGFMNPWLYKKGYTAFTDITSGSTLGCNRRGFPAQAGWDAASGFGSPNFQKILQVLGVS